MNLAKISKAITAAILAAGSALTAAGDTGSWQSLLTALIAGVVAGVAVWRIPNKPA